MSAIRRCGYVDPERGRCARICSPPTAGWCALPHVYGFANDERVVEMYPKPRRERLVSDRRWRVDYDLVYDGGGSRWSKYYRTKSGACIAVWLNMHVFSWGGSAILIRRNST